MAVIEFTKEDQGKPVVDASGERIGRVVDTRGGTAYVEPDSGVVETVEAKLGWGGETDDAYPLNGDDVAEVTDDAVRLDPL